jgi:hypothetical protein
LWRRCGRHCGGARRRDGRVPALAANVGNDTEHYHRILRTRGPWSLLPERS